MESHWRRCSICKKDLDFEQTYWVCNVSTCNRKRTGLVFCSVECWDAHLPSMRHRESWAEERTAPSRQEWQRERARESSRAPAARTPRSSDSRPAAPAALLRKASHSTSSGSATAASQNESPPPLQFRETVPMDVLVVTSKLKGYINARAGMKTSDAVARVLSDRLRDLCDEAIRKAHAAERITVLDRDFSD